MVTKLIWRMCAVIVLCGTLLAPYWAFAAPYPQDDAIELVYGQTVEGQLSAEQPSVFYAFDAQIADVVTITMQVTEGEIDPFLVLNDPARSPMATDDNSGGGVNARLTFVIPADGRYVIQATHAGGIAPETGGLFSLNLTAGVNEPTPPAEESTEEAPATDDIVLEPEETPEPSDIPTEQGDSIRLMALSAGVAVQDTLDRQTAFRLYWFEAQPGDQISISPQPITDFLPVIVLYNSDFAEQQRAAPGIGLVSTLSEAGIYFLAVSLPDTASAGGEFRFVFNMTANPATEGDFIDIVYGESQQGNLDANVPVITYRFRGSAGDAITITMSRVGGDLNSYLYLLDGNGQLLFEDNDSGGGNGDAKILYTLPVDGEYLIVAARMGQAQGTTSGSYLVELTSDSPPPAEETAAQPVLPADYESLPQIAFDETVEGELSNFKYLDIYVFQGSEGDAITIEMQSLNADQPNGLDPMLILLDDGRIPLIDNDDIVEGEQRDARIEFTLPRTAYYAIVATRFDQDAGTSAGPYALTLTLTGEEAAGEEPEQTVALDTPAGQLAPMALQPGTPIQATFDSMAGVYGFSGTAGSLVDISVTTDPGLDSVLILTDANLTEVLSSGTGALTGVSLPAAGDYVVLVLPRFGPIESLGGGYILALAQEGAESGETVSEPASGPQQITYGETVSGVIDDATVSRLYTFTGTAGETVRVTMKAVGSSLDCYLELQDANGTVIEANDDINPGVVRDSQILAELPADGTYQVLASRYVGPDAEPTSGSYELTLERGDDAVVGGVSPVTIPITYNESIVGEINDEQYLLFYVFDGTAGDVVTISIDNLSGNLDSVLYLYQSVGAGWAELASNDDSPSGNTYAALLSNITLPQTGKYLIAVSRYGLERENTFGTFSITLTLES
jgi:hypothetical protein